MVMLALSVVAGTGAAVDYSADYSGNDAVLVSEQFETTDDIATIYADVSTTASIDNTNNETTVRWIVQGINESKAQNASTLANETRTIPEDSLEKWEYEVSDSNREDYNSFYLHVEAETDHNHIQTVDNGTLYSKSGGGGGFLPGGGGSNGMIALVVVAGALVYGRYEDYV